MNRSSEVIDGIPIAFWEAIRIVQSNVSVKMSQNRMISSCVFLVCIGCSAATATDLAAKPRSISVTMPVVRNSATVHEAATDRIVGTWEAQQYGHQILTTRPDGTATIKMSLTPMAAVLYGRQVTLELLWTLEGEILTQRIIGGSPARSVEKLIAKFGDTQQFRLLETNRDQLLVAKVQAGSNPVSWTAVAESNR